MVFYSGERQVVRAKKAENGGRKACSEKVRVPTDSHCSHLPLLTTYE